MSLPLDPASYDQHDTVLVPITISDVPFSIGYLLNFGLFGILTFQVFIYGTRFRKDRPWLRIAVFAVFILEFLNSVLVMYSMIYGASVRCLSCLVTGQRDSVVNDVSTSEAISIWAFQVLCVLTGISSSVVQIFFAWRIWVLGKSIWIPIAVILISLSQGVLLVAGGIVGKTYSQLGVLDTDEAVGWLIISAVCDVLIAARTTQLLFRSGEGSQCQATQSLIRKLIKMTIETGLVTMVATILEFILAQTLGIAHHAVFYSLSKLYANCLLATLNVRLTVHNIENHQPTVAEAQAVERPVSHHNPRTSRRVTSNSRTYKTPTTYKSVAVQMDDEEALTPEYVKVWIGSDIIRPELVKHSMERSTRRGRSRSTSSNGCESDWEKGTRGFGSAV